jgi:hypothetical protein
MAGKSEEAKTQVTMIIRRAHPIIILINTFNNKWGRAGRSHLEEAKQGRATTVVRRGEATRQRTSSTRLRIL